MDELKESGKAWRDEAISDRDLICKIMETCPYTEEITRKINIILPHHIMAQAINQCWKPGMNEFQTLNAVCRLFFPR